jgi:calcineurin-like phosphoesterase family protein
MLNFVDTDGNKIRPFDSVKDMNDCMTTNWNENIKPENSRVYHCGDFGMDSTYNNTILPKLHGSKRLILGNHDTVKGDLINHFSKISMWRIFKEFDFVCSHVPLREDSMFKVKFNVHGHIHQNPDPSIRHLNISVERTNYKPLHLDEILAEIKKRREQLADQ